MRITKSTAGCDRDQHIASVLVHAQPAAQAQVARHIARLDGVSIDQATDDGRMILLAEAHGSGQLADQFDALSRVPGVLTVNLIFHHAEAAAELDRPVAANPSNAER